MVNNKQVIMAEVLEAVKTKFNVKARANTETFRKEVTVNITILDIPSSVEKVIYRWANEQGFGLYIHIRADVTPTYQARINTVCAAANAQWRMESDMLYLIGVGCKQVICYNGVDQDQASEALWLEDQTGIKAAIEAVFVSKVVEELQYA